MKRTQLLFFVLTWLSYVTMTCAQGLTIETKPTDLPDELSSMALLGSSSDGRYLYGALSGRGFAFDTKTNKYAIYGDEKTTCEVVGISSDGWSLLQTAEAGEQSGLSNGVVLVPLDSTNGEHSIFVTSPDPNHPYFTLWHLTSDAKYFCGTILDSGWESIPVIGERSADGKSYKVSTLPVPDKDPLGTTPQQFRLIYVSEDGATLVGFLVEESGNLATVMTYQRKADGTYGIQFPADDVLFDHTITVPPYPEYDDYVTVPTDPEDPNYDAQKLQEQEDAYNKAYDEYYRLFDLFSRNLAFKQHSLAVGSKGRYALVTVVENGVDDEGFRYTKAIKYLSVDLKSGKAELTNYPEEVSEEVNPRDLLGEQRDLLYAEPVGGSRYWDAFVYTHDQKTLTLLEWVKGETQQDFSAIYSIPDPVSGEPTIHTGWPEVSMDGKTVTLLGYPNDASKTYRNSYFRFGQSILPIAAVCGAMEQRLRFDGELLHVAEPSCIYLFNVQGELLYQNAQTTQLDMNPLRHTLPQGDYIVLAVNAQGNSASLKISL